MGEAGAGEGGQQGVRCGSAHDLGQDPFGGGITAEPGQQGVYLAGVPVSDTLFPALGHIDLQLVGKEPVLQTASGFGADQGGDAL